MAAFDAARLDTTQYQPEDFAGAIFIIQTIEDFVNVIRTHPAYLDANGHLTKQFVELISNDEAFPPAQSVFPELRYPKTNILARTQSSMSSSDTLTSSDDTHHQLFTMRLTRQNEGC